MRCWDIVYLGTDFCHIMSNHTYLNICSLHVYTLSPLLQYSDQSFLFSPKPWGLMVSLFLVLLRTLLRRARIWKSGKRNSVIFRTKMRRRLDLLHLLKIFTSWLLIFFFFFHASIILKFSKIIFMSDFSIIHVKIGCDIVGWNFFLPLLPFPCLYSFPAYVISAYYSFYSYFLISSIHFNSYLPGGRRHNVSRMCWFQRRFVQMGS